MSKPVDALVLAGKNAANESAAGLKALWANISKHQPGFTKDIFDLFDQVDRDEDGFLSLAEIDRACSDRRIRGHKAAALATLKRVLDEIEDLADDEIGFETDGATRADLAGFDMREVGDPEDEVVQAVKGRYARAKKKVAKAPREVFQNESSPSIDPASCRQGMLGDCFFLAPMMFLAFNRVDDLLSMFERVDALEWRITFPGAEKSVIIPEPSDAEIALFASAADGLWPIILEMAYSKQIYNSPYGMLSRSRIDPLDSGGVMGMAIEVLTGHSSDADFLSATSVSTTRDKLGDALGSNKIVCAGIRGELPAIEDRKVQGLARAHAYTILAFDTDADVVTLRNPWGNTEDLPNGSTVEKGVLTLPLDQLDEIFTMIYYEE